MRIRLLLVGMFVLCSSTAPIQSNDFSESFVKSMKRSSRLVMARVKNVLALSRSSDTSASLCEHAKRCFSAGMIGLQIIAASKALFHISGVLPQQVRHPFGGRATNDEAVMAALLPSVAGGVGLVVGLQWLKKAGCDAIDLYYRSKR